MRRSAGFFGRLFGTLSMVALALGVVSAIGLFVGSLFLATNALSLWIYGEPMRIEQVREPAPPKVPDHWRYPAPTALDDWRYPPRPGAVFGLDGARVDYGRMREAVRKYEPAEHSYTFRSRAGDAVAFVVAPAVDGKLHSPQAFMLGQVPYRVEQAWMPLYALSERMRYQGDKSQFGGRADIWLTTLQAWSRARGDCEDHALLLADWLIDMGLDARVVLGDHGSEGHAWVVVFKDGQEYLLEATDKQKLRRWAAYPLARLLPEYHPEMMFNRDTLWVNTGSTLTVNYAGPHWKAVVTFAPNT